jgi:predicted PurR-regulated permease PerM
VGTLTTLGLWLAGVPYALLLGVVAGLLDVVPFVGPLLAAGPGVLLAFGQSWQTGAWAIAVYFTVQQVEGYGLYPWLMGQAVSLHPVWVLLALLLGGELFGVPGLALAVPAAVTLHVLLQERAQHQAEGDQQQQGTGQEGHAG